MDIQMILSDRLELRYHSTSSCFSALTMPSVHWSVFVNILECYSLMNLAICLKMLFIEHGGKYCTWKTNGKYHTNQWLCASALVTEWNLLLQQWNVREPFSLPTVVTASNPFESATITRVKRFVLHLPIKKGNRTDGFESNTPVEVNKGSIVQLSDYLAVVCLLGNVCAGFVVCWSCNDDVINFFCCILFGCKKQQPLVPTPHLPGLRSPFRPIYHCFQAVPTWSLHLIPEFVCGIGRSRATRWGFFRGWQCLQQPGGRLKDHYRCDEECIIHRVAAGIVYLKKCSLAYCSHLRHVLCKTTGNESTLEYVNDLSG